MCHNLLHDPKIFQLLYRVDEALAEEARTTRCACGCPVGHFKIPHLWSPKIPQAGRVDYQLTEGFCASRVAASLSR